MPGKISDGREGGEGPGRPSGDAADPENDHLLRRLAIEARALERSLPRHAARAAPVPGAAALHLHCIAAPVPRLSRAFPPTSSPERKYKKINVFLLTNKKK